MKTAAAARHLAFEGLGLTGPWLKRRGWRSVTCDVALHPFLAEEVDRIRRRIDRGRPLLGICLGAPLMARALWAAVVPMRAKEIGYGPLTFTPEGAGLSQAPDAVRTDWFAGPRL